MGVRDAGPTGVSLLTVQMWNSTAADGEIRYRSDWVELTGELLDTLSGITELRVRSAAESTDLSLIAGGIRSAGEAHELDMFDARTFVVTAVVPTAAAPVAVQRLDRFAQRHQVAPMWVASTDAFLIIDADAARS